MGQASELFENTCRLCDENCSLMHSVFERAPEGQQVMQLIQDCLRILIYRTDPLPKQICDSCYHNILNFSSFKKVSFENLHRQKEKLQECNLENNKSIQLYLNALEQDTFDESTILNCSDRDEEYLDSSTISNSILPNTISDSITIIKITPNNASEKKLMNGHIFIDDEDDDDDNSQTSSSRIKTRSNESLDLHSQTADSQSDADEGDYEQNESPRIITRTLSGKRRRGVDHGRGPALKKRKLMGPKSKVDKRKKHYLKILHQQKFGKKTTKIYQPLSLLQCSLNIVNKHILPDHVYENFKTNEVDLDSDEKLQTMYANDENVQSILEKENFCNYCDAVFSVESDLAIHEKSHMYVALGMKVDDSPPSSRDRTENGKIIKKWWEDTKPNKKLKSNNVLKEKIVENFDDSTGRVNVIDPDDVDFKDSNDELIPPNNIKREGYGTQGEVILIDTHAHVNGVLLSDLPKDERRTLYQNVTVNGVKRKFCPLCRYTFKDNWAIESHYFSTACHFTCRFCGVRFNKQRNEFDAHIKEHIESGDMHTNKIFASRKFQAIPKVIHHSKVKERPPYVPRQSVAPKVKPIKMKHLLEKQNNIIEIKKERIEEEVPPVEEKTNNDGLKQNQAYFCRKCYQMFYKLNEFNTHITNCKGTAYTNLPKISAIHMKGQFSPPSRQSEPEKFSPTGRPMRNCVREIGTYADDMQDDNHTEYSRYKRMAMGKPTGGFECEMCSSCFPTVHSRNSHMRIHKPGWQPGRDATYNTVTISNKKPGPQNATKGAPNVVRKYANIKIKQEPIEPMVEIHEQAKRFSSSVSITPISGGNKNLLDPKIMKLVQNNPNITIKTRPNSLDNNVSHNNVSQNNVSPANNLDDGRSYRCLSCSQPFANKSNLYFHKKNHCSGSKYPCPFCKKRFGSESAYSSHIFYNHPE